MAKQKNIMKKNAAAKKKAAPPQFPPAKKSKAGNIAALREAQFQRNKLFGG